MALINYYRGINGYTYTCTPATAADCIMLLQAEGLSISARWVDVTENTPREGRDFLSGNSAIFSFGGREGRDFLFEHSACSHLHGNHGSGPQHSLARVMAAKVATGKDTPLAPC